MAQDFTACTAISISWETLHRDARMLAHKLKRLGPFNGVVAVARGGLIPAAIVARELGLRLVETVCVASYDERVQRRGEPELLKSLDGDGTGWVVVDDLADSGNTFRKLRKGLPKAHFAAIYVKPRGADAVDTSIAAVEQDLWLVFPWDEA